MAMENPSSGQTALPVVYTLDRLHFTQQPGEEQLLALLGAGREFLTYPKLTITPPAVVLRPWTYSMKFVLPWTAFILALITGLPLLIKATAAHVELPAFYGWIALAAWIVLFPLFVTIGWAASRAVARAKPYAVADIQKHTLTLPRVNVTIPLSDIVCITVVQRWYCINQWQYVVQTAVLARDWTGECDYYPIVQTREGILQTKIGLRFANALNVPAREITRSLADSEALSDANRSP
jgi:hypothetical protein